MSTKIYLYTTCQVGAEKVLKTEVRQLCPQLNFSFSRPGFLTFKITSSDSTATPEADVSLLDAVDLASELQRKSVFARFVGVSLGKLECDTHTDSDIAEKFWNQVAVQLTPQTEIDLRKIRYVHCFSRDSQQVGKGGFEPGGNNSEPTLRAILSGAKKHLPQFQAGIGADRFDVPTRENEIVLNLTHVEDNVFWVGLHRTGTELHTRYAGGLLPIDIPHDMVSRAYLKFEEAIRWSGFPIGCGTCCVDIGSSPGGASQALLTRGVRVLGVDPAEMSPQVLAFPNFTHLRGRIGQIKRKLLGNCKYAVADMNVAPAFTLEVLEELVHRPEINLRGLIFTLKLFQWELVEKLDIYIARIRSWGFENVLVKQLQFNRQEITVAAR